MNIRELRPEDVEVGNLYFTPITWGFGRDSGIDYYRVRLISDLSLVPTTIIHVDGSGFTAAALYTQTDPYISTSHLTENQFFDRPIRGILVKQKKDGSLELLVGKEMLNLVQRLQESRDIAAQTHQ